VLQENQQYEITRFGNVIYDLNSIEKRPILGWSALNETRGTLDPEVSEIASRQGNGLTGMVVKYGVVGLLIYLLSTYRYFFSRTRRGVYSASGVVVLCILLMGEQYLNFPLFFALMFAGRRNAWWVPTRRWRWWPLLLPGVRRVRAD
jgi:hypothetical protein